MSQKIAVITGANAGIGLTLADRLLSIHDNLHICMACRNRLRAEAARNALVLSHPTAEVSIVLLDTSNIQSVLHAAEVIRRKFNRIDYLYLNAGKMSVTNLRYGNFFKGFLNMNVHFMLHTGNGLLVHSDGTTTEGLMNMFATNAFGHYVLVRELEDRLGGSQQSQVIWTSSIAAVKSSLLPNDLQHKNGTDPYGSSKCVIDAVSIELNQRLNSKGVYSHSTCPGFVLTNMTNGILASWIWMILLPFLWLLRLLLDHLNLNPYRGSESLVWLSQQKPQSLDPLMRYHSCTSVCGTAYINQVKISFTSEEAKVICEDLDILYKEFKQKYNKPCSNGHNGHLKTADSDLHHLGSLDLEDTCVSKEEGVQ